MRLLLEAGASLGLTNKQGETAMALMGNLPPGVLEQVLDSSVEGHRKEGNFVVTMTYPFLADQRQTQEKESPLTNVVSPGPAKEEVERNKKEINVTVQMTSLPETTALLFLTSSKEHDHLLEHPVIASFLHMKWKSIELFFYIKFLCCLIFVTMVNAYVFLLNANIGPEGDHLEDVAESGVRWTMFALLLLLTLRELPAWPYLVGGCVGAVRSPGPGKLHRLRQASHLGSYLGDPENFLRVALVISSYLLLFLPWDTVRVKHLSGVTVLISWLYGIFFIANHPANAVYAKMFTTISTNFFKVLLWLFWFVFAFALTFFFIFRSTDLDDEGNQVNPSFSTAKEAILKTIVMVFTGELDFGGIVFLAPFGKFIFALFVFFIMLVLMNLLNGLAISDIAVIQRESEINTQIARMKVICIYESLCVNNSFLKKYGGFCLVSANLQGTKATFELKEQHWKGVNCDLVPRTILESAKSLVVNRSFEETVTENFEIKERLQKIELTLEKISEKLSQLS